MYAGCGPYALLSILATSFFQEGEVLFTAMDIHAGSVQAASKLIHEMDVAEYFMPIMCMDATLYKCEPNNRPDIIVAECMLNALRNETQVSVAANLVPQLGVDGIMIPENIEVNAVLVDAAKRHAVKMGEAHWPNEEVYINLGNVVSLSKETALRAANNLETPFEPVTISLPETLVSHNLQLELHTVVKVYGDAVLRNADSALTLPLKLADAGTMSGKTQLHCIYENKDKPGIKWQLL